MIGKGLPTFKVKHTAWFREAKREVGRIDVDLEVPTFSGTRGSFHATGCVRTAGDTITDRGRATVFLVKIKLK